MRRRLLLALAVLATVSAGSLSLLGARLIGVAALSPAAATAAWLSLVGLFALVLGGMILPRVLGKGPQTDRMSWVGMLGMALLGNLAALTLLRDVVWVTASLVGGVAAVAGVTGMPAHDGWMAGSSAWVVGLSLGLVGWGIRNARCRRSSMSPAPMARVRPAPSCAPSPKPPGSARMFLLPRI